MCQLFAKVDEVGLDWQSAYFYLQQSVKRQCITELPNWRTQAPSMIKKTAPDL